MSFFGLVLIKFCEGGDEEVELFGWVYVVVGNNDDIFWGVLWIFVVDCWFEELCVDCLVDELIVIGCVCVVVCGWGYDVIKVMGNCVSELWGYFVGVL